VAGCAGCGEKFAAFRTMHDVMSAAPLKEIAPAHLRNRIEALIATPASRVVSIRQFMQPTRRSFFGGFAMGSVLSGQSRPVSPSRCFARIRSRRSPRKSFRRISVRCKPVI
jgi:hypothetical protein